MNSVDNHIEFIEDCLETIAGLRLPAYKFKINPADIVLIQSLARQTFRGVALTDRQYSILKEKLTFHADQFNEFGISLTTKLRMPLRSIDRSKWIKLTRLSDSNDFSIEVRFVFNKKYIEKINYIKRHVSSHKYDPVEKIHSFSFDENTVYSVISVFEDCSFDIDEELLDYYKKVKEMMENKNNYIPGIYSYKLKNLNQTSIDYMITSYGEPTPNNLYMYNDRKNILGLEHFDQEDLDQSLNQLTPLSKKIIQRKSTKIFIDSTQYNCDRIVESLLELNRYPLLVVLPEKAPLEPLHQIVSSFRNIIPKDSMSVLFRTDNDTEENKNFNLYIKENELNNPIDITSKIVYINDNKIPKPLLKSKWTPQAILCLVDPRIIAGTVTVNTRLTGLFGGHDLTIFYHTHNSIINQYRNGVEQIG